MGAFFERLGRTNMARTSSESVYPWHSLRLPYEEHTGFKLPLAQTVYRSTVTGKCFDHPESCVKLTHVFTTLLAGLPE